MRPMLQSTRDIWRAVRDAGEAGLRARAVRGVAKDLPAATITERLSAMRRHGYLRYEGVTSYGVWHVGNRAPAGETLKIGAGPVPFDVADPRDSKFYATNGGQRLRERPLRPAPSGPPQGVPASVWALAAMCAGQP